MPELPEVETVARQLAPLLSGITLDRVVVYDDKLRNSAFKKLHGARVVEVFRVGKTVVVELKNPQSFVQVHLRMTGRLIWAPKGSKKTGGARNKPRLRLCCSKGELAFFDTRRFGTVTVCSHRAKLSSPGVDPMGEGFTLGCFRALIGQSKQAVKVWLLRQDKVVGIGNIYASEILFRSKIDPTRAVSSLNSKEVEALYRSIVSILKRAIKHCGTTFSDFQDTTGSIGSYQKYLKVYKREAERCLSCSKEIVRISQGQRSTFYCPACQR
jgi:formamidopyrimidine-DNA glycosylase